MLLMSLTMPQKFMLLYVLILAFLSAKAASTVLLETLTQTEDKNFQDAFIFNTTTVLRILRQLEYFTLYLSNINDCYHTLVRFLIEQEVCSLQLFIGELNNGTQRVNRFRALDLKYHIPQRNRAVYVQAAELPSILRVFASKAGYLICIIADDLALKELKEMSESLWHERGIYRVYYFLRTHSWFYNPFARQNDEFGALIDANSLYDDQQIFVNMNGYVIRTYIFDSVYSSVFGNVTLKTITEAQGADSEAAMLLSEKMNFTMKLQWPDDEFFGARLENGSYNGAIGRILRSETDVVLTGFFVKDYLTRGITFTVSVYMDELCCYVMKARRIPQSILPLFAVRVDIWFVFFLVGLISSPIWMLIRYLNLYLTPQNDYVRSIHLNELYTQKKNQTHYQYVRIFIDTWVVWVRVNVTCFPPFYSERIFMVSLSLVSVIYFALFESSLATVYIHPLYYKDINTLQELDNTGFRIYIKHAAMRDDLFYGHNSFVYQNLNHKIVLVSESEERLISIMSKRGGFAAVTRASSMMLDDIRYLVTNKIHLIPECPKNYHIAFVLPRLSPYEEPFNVNLLHFVEAGLIIKWIDEMKHRARTKIQTFPDYGAENVNQWKVLTLKDLQLSFYALGIGCVFAFLSLAGEIILKFKFKMLKLIKK